MSIAKLITEFITDSAKSATPVADLLEQARTIASVIEDNDFAKFCEKELNGYDEKDKVPDYRQIAATRQIWYDGPLLKPEDKRVAVGNHYTFSCRNPIKDISGVVASGKDYISAPWDDEEFRGYKNRNVIELHLLQKLEIEVRKKINDWKTLKIKEGKFFTDFERNVSITNFYGNINRSNIVGSAVNSTLNIGNVKEFDYDAAKKLLEFIKELTKDPSVNNDDRDLLNTQIEKIDQKINQKDFKSIRMLLNSLGVWAQSITCSVIGSDIYNKIDAFLKTIQ